MSEPKHTPGPWGARETANGWTVETRARDAGNYSIVAHVTGSPQNPISASDAALIASAPDLARANGELTARVRELEKIGWHLASLCNECGGSGRATEELEDETPCPDCGPARAALARGGSPRASGDGPVALYRCHQCGSADVEGTAWVRLNTGEDTGSEPPDDDIWCAVCEEEHGDGHVGRTCTVNIAPPFECDDPNHDETAPCRVAARKAAETKANT